MADFKLGLFGIWFGMDIGNTFVVALMARAVLRLDFSVEAQNARQKALEKQQHQPPSRP